VTKPVTDARLAFDRAHIWHPYSTVIDPAPVFPVASAHGCRLRLQDGRELIDGMASWWSAIHGYNHPVLNEAVRSQLSDMSHVMFGGLTHAPAISLAERLLEITPPAFEHVFFADSGSVSVEVAIKMALQYQVARGRPRRKRLLTLRGGYHGDTFGAMSVCDPVTGMHSLFAGAFPEQLFAPRPGIPFGGDWDADETTAFEGLLRQHADEIAAVILEPVVQGAGGMWFYHPAYLAQVRKLCSELGVLLIADEIATGFGRTGRLFASEHADVAADILCLGKGLTGGYMTLAATLTTAEVARGVCESPAGVFMHGPTFMANPLACACAEASIALLLDSPWQTRIAQVAAQLEAGLAPCRELPVVRDVRVLGAIGVVELTQEVDMRRLPQEFVNRGVWVRPFGRLVYVMPPYIITDDEIAQLTSAILAVVSGIELLTA
jgi:adenosylmethionine-8-amino-7-oxononanoate aminotransferase